VIAKPRLFGQFPRSSFKDGWSAMVPELLFRSASRTHVGLVRNTNEDAILAMDGLRLWAVSDGMGGHAAGDMASGLIVDRLRALGDEDEKGGLEDRARAALLQANADVCTCNEIAVPPTNMGATVAVLGVDGTRYFCLWSGDSRIYRLRDGCLTQLSSDHRYVQTLIDAGVLSEADASHHPQRNIVTHAVGVVRDLRLDRCESGIDRNDMFVLLTDGVSSLCSNAEIAQMVRRDHLENSADALTELCLARGAPDNFSLILVAPTLS
jgi:serine/threonine-protein phosphatase Stp1